MTSDAYLDSVVAKLAAVAADVDVPTNLSSALWALLEAAPHLPAPGPSSEAVERVFSALAAALGPAQAHFGSRVDADVIHMGLTSAGGIVRLYGPGARERSEATCALACDWIDCVRILLNDIDTAQRLASIRRRNDLRFRFAPSLAIH